MKLKIKIHANSSQEKIQRIDENFYEVWINVKPVNGKANKYLEKYLKKYFKKDIKIVSGLNSKIKFIELN